MTHKIKPLDNYLHEDFYNPFDEKDESVPKETSHISDRSMRSLLPRKETFNINRVEYSKRDNGGYTVLSKTQFAKGEIVEICPIIFVGSEAKSVKILKDYIFEIDKEKDTYGVVLGYGSIFRHDATPNCDFVYNRSNKQMYFITNRPIKVAEELSINYGTDYWSERMNFNLMSDTENNTSPQQSPNGETDQNESEVQPNAEEMQDKTNMKALSTPNNRNSPVISGQIIGSTGQA